MTLEEMLEQLEKVQHGLSQFAVYNLELSPLLDRAYSGTSQAIKALNAAVEVPNVDKDDDSIIIAASSKPTHS